MRTYFISALLLLTTVAGTGRVASAQDYDNTYDTNPHPDYDTYDNYDDNSYNSVDYNNNVNYDDDYYTDVGPQYTTVSTVAPGAAVPDPTYFYDQLAPYGVWYDDAAYGYVFVPSLPNYTPYTNGYWTFTALGWVWNSLDPFGWATDHYGRWLWRGTWVWRPDTVWGPAWVQWRASNDYIGWAPMGYDEFYDYVPTFSWHFVGFPFLTAHNLRHHYAHHVDEFYGETYPMWNYHRGHNNRWWVAGPDADYLRDHRVNVNQVNINSLDLNRVGRLDEQTRQAAEQRIQADRQAGRWQDRLAREQEVRPLLATQTRQAEAERARRAAEQAKLDEQRRELDNQQRAARPPTPSGGGATPCGRPSHAPARGAGAPTTRRATPPDRRPTQEDGGRRASSSKRATGARREATT